MTTNVTTIDNQIELLIEDLPQSIISANKEAKIKLALLQLGLDGVGEATAGILGGVRKATLRVGQEYYTLKWSLKVLKPLTALEVSSLAVNYINAKVEDQTFDKQMATTALNYIRDMFDDEFDPRRKASRRSFIQLLLGD